MSARVHPNEEIFMLKNIVNAIARNLPAASKMCALVVGAIILMLVGFPLVLSYQGSLAVAAQQSTLMWALGTAAIAIAASIGLLVAQLSGHFGGRAK